MVILGAIVMAPVAKAEVLMGEAYTTQIEQMELQAELKRELIALIVRLIDVLQQQLNTMIAQQNSLNQIAQNTAPLVAQPSPAVNNAPVQTTMPEAKPFPFEPKVFQYPGYDLAMTIAEKFDKCILVITDENGKEVRRQDAWMTDSQGNSRQVYSMSTKGQHLYEVTCSKAGFDTTIKTGNFPLAAE